MQEPTVLEAAVMGKLLRGNHPALGVLRNQAGGARVTKRELTGVGFYCEFGVQPEVPTLGEVNFQIADVQGDLRGMAHGAGFVLFIRKGRIDTLEGYSYDEPWPAEVSEFKLSYDRIPRQLSFLPYVQ